MNETVEHINPEPIPRLIHSVWVGGGEKNAIIKRCERSWQRHLSHYEFIEWNEESFDIGAHPFAQEAYEQRKWAFVSDYIRAWALYNYGGIYLDTDVLVLDNFEHFRRHRAFVGFEREDYPFTAAFGAEKYHPLTEAIMESYEGRSFKLDPDDELSANNTISVSELLIGRFGCDPRNSRQSLQDGIEVYPDGILCNPSSNSSAIHIFTGTWLSEAPSAARNAVTSIKSMIRTKQQAGLYSRAISGSSPVVE